MGVDDLERKGRELLEGASQRAALDAGRAMARRALDDLTLSPDERAARDAAAARATKKKLVLAVVGVTVVAVVGIGLLQLIASLWLYAIGFAVIAGVVGVGALLLKPRLDAWKARLLSARQAKEADALVAAQQQQQAQAAAAAAAAKQQAAQKLEDELARLKRQAGGG